MLELLDSPAEVIAARLTGSITAADLEAVMDRLDIALAGGSEVHVFVETHGVTGIELAGLPDYIARAMPLFGQLSRFGRVAVVADQAWVRMATRFESAILPFISYRVFEPHERDTAFAWVVGKTARSVD